MQMIPPEALAITYGLSSGLSWGAGDFSGGLATKKTGVLSVIFYSQIIGGLLLIGLLLFFAQESPAVGYFIWGGSAGFWGALGLVALYQGLAVGRMGIVAPISAVVTAMGPMIFAFFIEGLPKGTQIIGFGGAILAVWLFSSAQRHSPITRVELTLSVLSGIGFSLFFICIDRVSNESILWPLVAARIVSVTLMSAILVFRRQLVLPEKRPLPYIALAGILDAGGNAFFALASQAGRLDVSVILVAAIYPLSTVMLARCFLKERLHLRQRIGLLATCIAVALIAT